MAAANEEKKKGELVAPASLFLATLALVTESCHHAHACRGVVLVLYAITPAQKHGRQRLGSPLFWRRQTLRSWQATTGIKQQPRPIDAEDQVNLGFLGRCCLWRWSRGVRRADGTTSRPGEMIVCELRSTGHGCHETSGIHLSGRPTGHAGNKRYTSALELLLVRFVLLASL